MVLGFKVALFRNKVIVGRSMENRYGSAYFALDLVFALGLCVNGKGTSGTRDTETVCALHFQDFIGEF